MRDPRSWCRGEGFEARGSRPGVQGPLAKIRCPFRAQNLKQKQARRKCLHCENFYLVLKLFQIDFASVVVVDVFFANLEGELGFAFTGHFVAL